MARLVWFDANRVCAAAGVVMIHATADFGGGAFPDAAPAERLVPVALRAVAEVSGSEMFFLFSLFLLAMRVDRHRPAWGPLAASQARRLLVPFLAWTLFYAAFRLIKAQAFGYAPAILDDLGDPRAWAGYLLLGQAQYHLHFLPTLFVLGLFVPVMRLAARYPVLGLALAGTLGAMAHVQGWIWSLGLEPLPRDLLLRGAKVMGYVGYGFAAFAIHALWRDGLPRGESRLIGRGAIYAAAMAWLCTLPAFGQALATGAWAHREGWGFYGHFLMPVFVFGAFLGAQHLDWSPRWSRAARYTFGVYLVHPLVIDLVDVALHLSGAGAVLGPAALVGLRLAVVLPSSAALAVAIGHTPALAWTAGLGPAPWSRHPRTAEA